MLSGVDGMTVRWLRSVSSACMLYLPPAVKVAHGVWLHRMLSIPSAPISPLCPCVAPFPALPSAVTTAAEPQKARPWTRIVAAMQAWMMRIIQTHGFLGILLLASWPNAAFDLCGICCGAFLMPFWEFFGATLIGKGVIKVNGQALFFTMLFRCGAGSKQTAAQQFGEGCLRLLCSLCECCCVSGMQGSDSSGGLRSVGTGHLLSHACITGHHRVDCTSAKVCVQACLVLNTILLDLPVPGDGSSC